MIVISNTQSSKLNVAIILLPIFDDFPTNFTIQATNDSCYKWSTTREDIIELNPVDLNSGLECTTQVVVSTVTKERRRITSDVFAEDINTKQQLRCVVITDVIESLGIASTTKELMLEEAPEVFEVRAYDNQGNEFSTLEGIEFEWMIKPSGPNKNVPVLRFITFKDSPYETPSTLNDIENRNKRGHKVLLEGIKTGISKVSVKLPQKDYANAKSNELQLTVIANLMILPQEVYIMVGDSAEFQIIQTSYGKSETINLRSSQYFLDVEDKQVARNNKYEGTVNSLQVGRTKVLLHDKNIDVNEPGLRLPFAILNVVQPAYMMLNLLPYRNWAALVSEPHDIIAEVFSEGDHKLILGPHVKIQMQVEDAFKVKQRSMNGSVVNGWTQLEGTAKVQAILESATNPFTGTIKVKPPIPANGEIMIYPRIVLQPSEVILPWDEVVKPKYDIDIKAIGGDGKFLWSSSNHSLGVVNQQGKVHTHSQGYFEVSASMHRNHHNRQTAKFHILPPSRLEIVEFVMEAEIGTVIFLHVALYAERKIEGEEEPTYVPFTKCQELPFKVKMSDPKFNFNRALTSIPVGISCGSLAILSSEVGSSKVTVSYLGINGKVLQDSVSVSYYKPLFLMQPTGTIVLAVGTRTNLIFTGGPPSVLGIAPNKYLTSNQPEIATATVTTKSYKMPSDDDYTVVSVVCHKLGRADITLKASNIPNLPNCKNKEATATVTVHCSKPRHIELQPEIKVADAKSCPMDLSADRVVVESNRDVDLIIKVKDDKGREFMNITSFLFEWEISEKKAAELGNKKRIQEKTLLIGNAFYADKSYQKILPKLETGQITILVKLAGYRKDVTNANKVTPEWPAFLDDDEKKIELPPIKSSITLYLVDDTLVTPNIISMYNHPANKQFLEVKQGSGFYQIALDKEDVADVKYSSQSRQLEITPKGDGILTIKLIDLCLISKPAIISATVVSVHIIRVEMSDKVEVGKCITCIVRLYDEFDNLLMVPNLDLVEINHVFDKDIAKIEKKIREEMEIVNSGELHYIVTGSELGDTKLVFSIGEPEYDGYVASGAMELQVFPPLRLYPRNITVAVGAHIQYSSRGGPQPTPHLEYSIKNPETAQITNNGIIKGVAVGKTRVMARALGTNPTTGQRVIYTEDAVEVKVIKLSSIKISGPLTRMQVGATIPLWASGVPEQITPLILGSIDPPVRFDWGVQDSDVAKITGPFQPTGVEYKPCDMLSIRLKGLNPGNTVIYLNATYTTTNYKKYIYASSIEVEVFDKLIITEPKGLNGKTVFLAPYSQVQLKTNMDSWGHLTYKLYGDNALSTTDVQTNQHSTTCNPVSVTQGGLVRSYGNVGHSMIVISSVDTTGLKQTTTLPIEVKPIHYMLLSINSNWMVKMSSPTVVVPLGTEFEIEATFYDNTGNEFLGSNIENLQIISSRLDLVRIKRGNDNFTFHVSTRKVGVTVFKVWSEGVEKTADYLKLHVEQAIVPSVDQVITGDVVCFKSPLIGKEDEGDWTVTDVGILNEHGKGVIIATGVKGGQASVIHSLHTAAPLQIRVNPISEIILDDYTEVLTNAPEKTYKAHVLLQSQHVKRKNNMVTGWDCAMYLSTLTIKPPIQCALEFDNKNIAETPDEVFIVTPKFNFREGKYYCDIAATPESNKKYNLLTTDVIMKVSAQDVLTQEVKLKFVPAPYIPNEILLDDSTFTGTLVIMGLNSVLKDIEIKPVDDSILIVESIKVEENKLTCVVKLIDYHQHWEDSRNYMSLEVHSKQTNQMVLVLVKAQNPDRFIRQCPLGSNTSFLTFLHTHRMTVGIVVAVAVMFFASFFVYSTYLQPTVNVNVLSNPKADVMNRSCGAIYNQNLHNRSTSAMMNTSGGQPDPCYCTRSPEIRRNRRYM